jgi:predicted nucleotidyltransferase
MYKGTLKGVIFYLIGGQILPYYYKYYSHILRVFGLNPSSVFKKLAYQTANDSTWNGKKITVKLAISNSKITDTKIALYPSVPK